MSVLKNGYEYKTSGYGNRTYTMNGKQVSDFHLGIDLISAKYGTDYIVVFESGKVTYAGYNGGYGNVVYIDHGNGYQTRYAHQKYLNVKVGDYVKKGDVLGYMGATGNVTGAHVHFEVRINGNTINPYDYVFNGKQFPISGDYTGVITYQVYTNKWLPEVYKCDNTDLGYAGIYGESIKGFRCKPEFGDITYEAHEIGGNWIGAVNSKDYSDGTGNSFAGYLNKAIDGIRIKSSKGYVDYRVHIKGGNWLPWARGFGSTGNEYAGIYGKEIDGLQMK